MAVPSSQVESTKKCVFCGQPGLSHTHIWPGWLNRKFPGDSREEVQFDLKLVAPGSEKRSIRYNIKQGNLFTQKPRLTCEACNGGWMNEFETGVLQFIDPIIVGGSPITLSEKQNRILCGWIMLITILAEMTLDCGSAISIYERKYLMKFRRPPDNWAIFAAHSLGPYWHKAWFHQVWQYAVNSDAYQRIIRLDNNLNLNTQATSLGIGHLYISLFSSQNWSVLESFEISAQSRGLIRLWRPRSRWPFPPPRTRLPANLTLSDEEARIDAHAFASYLETALNSGRPPPFDGA